MQPSQSEQLDGLLMSKAHVCAPLLSRSLMLHTNVRKRSFLSSRVCLA